MRFRIHHALFGGFLGVVGLLVFLIVVQVGTGLRRELVDLMRGQLERQLSLAVSLVDERESTEPDALAGYVTDRVGYRITLIARDGTVLGDSDVTAERLPRVENHAQRPEIRASVETGEAAFAERESTTVGQRFLYAAVQTEYRGRPVTLRIAAPLEEIEGTVARSQRAVAAAGLVSMLVALIVAYVLSRGLARPLVTLSDRAALLASGDFSLRAPRNSQVAELDELSLAFNRLADELQARLAELGRERDEMRALIDTMAEGVVALTDDARILRTNRTARELLGIPDSPAFSPVGAVVRNPELRDLLESSIVTPAQAREVSLGDRHLIVASRMLDKGGAVTTLLDVTELRRLEEVRRDFVANASHELKTPLTSIRGFAETLLEEQPPPELERRFMESIRNNTLRLQRLVDDLLDLSRLESGGWVADPEPVDLVWMAREVWTDFEDRAAAKEVDFDVVGEGFATADAHGLEQVLRNLFDNALRYSPGGGRVEVRIRPVEAGVEVAVSDTGTGIPSRALPRIFERFYRADTSRDRQAGGTGLGLAIVRHLVHAMGGDVRAESELGEGTTIAVRLPRAEAPGGDTPPGSPDASGGARWAGHL